MAMTRMKAQRLQRGWTQTDLAFHSRVQPAEISRIERGQARPYPKQAARLAQALGLTEGELLESVPEPQTVG